MHLLLLAALAASPDLASIARDAQGRVGVSAVLLETGETIQLDAAGRYPMQSVYKFPIAYAVLREVDAGRFRLDQLIRVERADLVTPNQHSPLRDRHPQAGVEVPLRELLRLSTSESDGTACDVLLRIIGGPSRVMEHLSQLGLKDIAVANTEREIGSDNEVQYRNWATPAAAVDLLRAFHQSRGLSKQSHALLMQWMTETPTGLKRIKGLLPAGTRVTHKTGSSGTVNGVAAATNDIGIIVMPGGKHLAVAVFVADARASSETREAVIARVARALYDHFSAAK